jgi:outer membrane receptor protein involved in Fe transport
MTNAENSPNDTARSSHSARGSRFGMTPWRFALGLLLLSGTVTAFGQQTGSVSGTVVNSWDAAPLSSVVVTVRGTTLAAQTDATGRYTLNNVPPGDQVLRFSKSGFASAVVTDVRVLIGQTTTVNGNLRPEFYDMEEFEVTAEEFTEQTQQIIFERQQSSSLMEAIGSEQFSKLGAGDAGQIVSRVTGVSLVGGKYAVVRGLSDRYTRTLLNGVEVPSADPYRTSPQLDLFPSAMIDRISVSKTFTPDQPGASGGGTIDILTKPFPEKPFVKGSVGTSYNPESNLRDDFLVDPKTKTQMIALPSGPKALDPELFALTESIDKPRNATLRGETLQSANERRAQANAVSGLLRDLGTTDFAGVERTSPLNTSMNASAGRTVKIFDNPFGMFASVNYARNFRLLEGKRGDTSGFLIEEKRGRHVRSNINTDYGANVNLGYELTENHEIGFNFMLAHSVDEEARYDSSIILEGGSVGETVEKWQLHYTERDIQNYQLHGHHGLPLLADSKLDWTLSLANTSQDEPNHRFMNYFLDAAGTPRFGDSSLPVPQDPSRYYRKIDENGFNARADWTLPLAFMPEESRFKMGFWNSTTDRDFKEQYFGYVGSSGFDVANPNSYLNTPALLDYTAQPLGGIRTNYTWNRFVNFVVGRPYEASKNITAGYPMLDLGVLSWLRLIGGVRVEHTLMEIDTRDAGSSRIDQVDLLPSAGAVISFITNVNLRLSYSETIARPSFREKAPIVNYLPDEDLSAEGNPNLEMSSITSYDARLEWFPSPGDILSAGAFYKKLKKPIELFRVDLSDNVTWVNRDEATVMGVEFEARKSFEFLSPHLKGLTLGANVALIKSETEFTDVEHDNKTNAVFHIGKTRPLYSQSPYIINLDLSYDHPTSGTSFTLAANMTGERIILTTPQGPDIYEHSPISLDALISQKLGKIWTVRFGVRNILDPEYRQTFGENYDDNIRRAYRRGRTFSLSLAAEF